MESDRPQIQANRQQQHHKVHNEGKSYIKSNKKWKDFKLHQDIIQALYEDDKNTPTRVQSQTLKITVNPDHKKFNILIRAPTGSGKSFSFMIPILNSLEPGLQTAENKTFKGKVMKNEIFKPQGVIIVQNNMLQDQLQRILQSYEQFGAAKKSNKLKFKIGRIDKQMHESGDIVVAMPKSFLNRYQRGNLRLENCKFIAIDQVDEIFEQQRQTLADILKIAEANRPNVITCSATMKKQFVQFYEENSKDVIKININEMIQKQLGEENPNQRVKNYYKICESKEEIHKYIITTIFKHLYEKIKYSTRLQVLIFFDSIDQIKEFHEYFKARSSDFTSDQSEYLKLLTIGIIAAKKYEDGKRVEMTIKQKREIMAKFRNNLINILCATNIIARSVDIRNMCFVINVGPPKYSEKEADIDLDIFLNRLERLGRHNDRGLTLTLGQKNDLTRLIQGIKKIHKIDIYQMKDSVKLVQEVNQCIKWNAQ